MPATVPTLIACALLGVLLAQSWLPVGGGFVGAVAMVIAASALAARWGRDPYAPEMAERGAWLSSAATLVCLGFFLAKLALLGAGADLHARPVRAMAGQLWTLIGASVLAQWIARAPRTTRDERDHDIAARALAAAFRLLLAMQLALVLWFTLAQGGAPPPSGLLPHLFIASWMVAHVFYDLARIRGYASARAAPGPA